MTHADADSNLFSAIADNDLTRVEEALQAGANPNQLQHGITAFHACVELRDALDTRILDALIDAKGDINTPAENGKTALDHAVEFEVIREVRYFNPETEQFDIDNLEVMVEPPAQTVIALYERDAKATNHELRIGEIRDAMLDKEHIPLRHWGLKPHLRVMTARFEKQGDGMADALPQKVYSTETVINDGSAVPHYETIYVPTPAPEHGKDDPYLPFIKCLNYTGRVTYDLGMHNELAMWHEFMATIGPDWEKAAANIPAPEDLSEVAKSFHTIGSTIACQALLAEASPELMQEISPSNLGGVYLNSRDETISRLFFEGRTPEEAVDTAKTLHAHFDGLVTALEKISPTPSDEAMDLWSHLEQVTGISKAGMTRGKQQELFDLFAGKHKESPLPSTILAPRYAAMDSVGEALEACGFSDHIRVSEKLLTNAEWQSTGSVNIFDIEDEVQADKAAESDAAYVSPAFEPLKKHRLDALTEDDVQALKTEIGDGDAFEAELAGLTAEHYREQASRLRKDGRAEDADATERRAQDEEGFRARIDEQRRQQGEQGEARGR